MLETSKEYISKLKEFIECDTISNDPFLNAKKSKAFQSILKKTFPKVFKKCRFKEFNGSFIIEWIGRRSSAPILLMSHFDTANIKGDWEYNPLSTTVQDEKIYGRGVIESKGNLFCMLEACEELIAEDFIPEQDIYIASTCDKEHDDKTINDLYSYFRSNGTYFSYIIDEGGAVLLSPFNKDTKYAMVGVGEKESAIIKISAYSKGGKSLNPFIDSALARVAMFIEEFEYRDTFKVSIHPSLYPILLQFSDDMTGFNKFVFSRPKLFGSIVKKKLIKTFPYATSMIQTTLGFTKIEASDSVNTVSGEAYVIGNLSISLNDTLENALKRINKVAKYFDLEVEVIESKEASRISSSKSYQFIELEEVINEEFSDAILIPYISNVSSNSRSMERISSNCFRFIPFTLSVEQLESINGVNENIDISCFEKAISFYKNLFKK